MSANGRLVAFESSAQLVDDDVDQAVDIYLRDHDQQRTELISRGQGGLPAVGPPGSDGCTGSGRSSGPSITPDGRYIAFSSAAVNLVNGDTNELRDVFVYDRERQSMERISIRSNGDQTAGTDYRFDSFAPSISGDGRVVSFTSGAENLVAGDTNHWEDVFVRDRSGRRTLRVSVDSSGKQSEPCLLGSSGMCTMFPGHMVSSVSLDGGHVVFQSRAPDLVDGDTNGMFDVFVRDLGRLRTTRVSVASDGTEARDPEASHWSASPVGPAQYPWVGSTITGNIHSEGAARAMSADGRFVAFVSTASNLVPNDRNREGASTGYSFNQGMDAFVRDRKTGRTERVSVHWDGRELPHPDALSPAISAGGRYVGFDCSTSCDFCEGICEAGLPGPFAVFDRRTGALFRAPLSTPARDGRTFYGNPGLPDMSSTGRYVSFHTGRWDAPPGHQAFYRVDWGPALGVRGGSADTGDHAEPGDNQICISPDICIPPGSMFEKRSARHDVSERPLPPNGADIVAARFAYRPQLGDLYLRLDLSELSLVHGTPVLGDPFIVYGFRIQRDGVVYEVRGAPTGSNALFGLFRCNRGICLEVTRIEGGYGTTGESVVAALPLDLLGLENGGHLSRVVAFSGYGSYSGGDLVTLDEIDLR